MALVQIIMLMLTLDGQALQPCVAVNGGIYRAALAGADLRLEFRVEYASEGQPVSVTALVPLREMTPVGKQAGQAALLETTIPLPLPADDATELVVLVQVRAPGLVDGKDIQIGESDTAVLVAE